jgi:sigma-B regulation protein RsbU (phosphoserine phosphatase)
MAPFPDKRIADLQAVLEISRELAATVELMPLLGKVEAAARKVLGCERATIFLYDRTSAELYSRMATGVTQIRFSADRGIAGEAARTGRIVKVPDAYADSRFNPEIDRQTGFKTRDLIAFPLVGFDNSIVGVLQVLNKIAGSFDEWDDSLVSTFGAQVGVAVQRQMLLDEYAEKQRLQEDLNIARKIQQGLLPARPPQVPGFDIAGWNMPADETGGDCYDFLELENGDIAITVADATGHGIGPALMIAECRALFRAMISLSQDLANVSSRMNDLLSADLLEDRFVTAFLGVLTPDERTLSYLSAGHGPLIKYIRASDEFTELAANAVPLGIMPGMRFDSPDKFVMQPGDMMVLVTDGFFEWATAAREQFGIRRLCETIRRSRDLSAAEIIQRLHEAVVSFARGAPPG